MVCEKSPLAMAKRRAETPVREARYQPHFLFHRYALGQVAQFVRVAAARQNSQFFGGRERQAAPAFEKFLQPPVAGTALAPDDAGSDKLAAFAPGAAPLKPIFPTD